MAGFFAPMLFWCRRGLPDAPISPPMRPLIRPGGHTGAPPPLWGEGFQAACFQTFPLTGGRWPEGPDEGALQVRFGASSRRAPHDRVVPCRHGHAALLKNARCPGRAAERPGHQAVGMEEGTIPEKGGTQLLGGMTVAMPLMTTSPFWLVQTVSSLTMFFSAMISLTVAVAVTVSPKRTGLVNLSSWPR